MVGGLMDAGYAVDDFTDNEMAKLHVRHMVGGRANVADEVIYRFQFPERPGALMKFLNVLGERWNISMFHYRNHGSAWGRVLAGFQVPRKQRKALKGYLDEIGYLYWDETGNTAYQRFLR
jgi:threonine dehydratase